MFELWPPTDVALKKKISQYRQYLEKTDVVKKTNYEKTKDQIRLVDLGVRPYLQYQEAKKLQDAELEMQTSKAIGNFLSQFELK